MNKDPVGVVLGSQASPSVENNEQFRLIVETTPDCVKIVAADGTLLHINTAGLHMLGVGLAADVVGNSVYDLIVEEDREKFRRFNERVCQGEKESLEFDLMGPTGIRRHMETHATPFRYADGSTAQLSITRDVTERRRGERAAFLLAAVVASSDDAIISKDLNGIITSWNQGAERLFGYTAAEAVGKSITILIPPDRLAEEVDILARIWRGERIDHFETVRRRKDDSLLDISLTISPVKDRGGNIVGASKIARDITERKRIERELRRANAFLEQFAFSAGHDLREPLRTIKIYSDLLNNAGKGKLDADSLQYVSFLHKAANRLEMLVRDLLAYSQVNGVDKPPEIVDANQALAGTLANLAGAITEADARVTAAPLPSVPVHATHLQQLFQNLIGNAIKYRRQGCSPEIRVSAERENGPWRFTVRDNGIGIPPQYHETIFGVFKRLHRHEEYSGTGIGLALCRRIVDQYQGRIWVESQPGAGSSFHFTLPA